jgi:hypothetical protein
MIMARWIKNTGRRIITHITASPVILMARIDDVTAGVN